MSDLLGHSLGRYHILEQLGEGGMATVYKAFDTRLERDVAVKVIRLEQFGSAVIERMLKRFEREAKALARLSHPNIVKIHDFGEHEGIPYLVMEYLPGGTLKQRLGKAIPWQEALRLLLPIARALSYAHQQGMIHRDVKPSNILITHSGDPMLTDFGIAKILEGEDSQTLTGTGVGVGTPEYMAPEQWTGSTVPASDIYALGVVLYELVTGRKPYSADTPAAILIKQVSEPLPRPTAFTPSLPESVERLLLKSLAKNPGDRYPDMASLASAMEGLLTGAAPEPPPLPVELPPPPQPVSTLPVVPGTIKPVPSELSQATIDQGVDQDAKIVPPPLDPQRTIEQVDEQRQAEPVHSQAQGLKPPPLPPKSNWKVFLWLPVWIIGGCLLGGIPGVLFSNRIGVIELIILILVGGVVAGVIGSIVVVLRWRKVSGKQKEKIKQISSRNIQSAIEQEGVVPLPSLVGSTPTHTYPRWLSILWFALIWGFCYPFGLEFGNLLSSYIFWGGSPVSWIISFTVAGALGGFLTAFVLRQQKVIVKWKTIIWISAAWALSWGLTQWIGYAIGWLASLSIAGAMGAFLTLVFLHREQPQYTGRITHWLVYGWALGWAVGVGLISLFPLFGSYIDLGIAGFIAGTIGGSITIWRLRKSSAQPN